MLPRYLKFTKRKEILRLILITFSIILVPIVYYSAYTNIQSIDIGINIPSMVKYKATPWNYKLKSSSANPLVEEHRLTHAKASENGYLTDSGLSGNSTIGDKWAHLVDDFDWSTYNNPTTVNDKIKSQDYEFKQIDKYNFELYHGNQFIRKLETPRCISANEDGSVFVYEIDPYQLLGEKYRGSMLFINGEPQKKYFEGETCPVLDGDDMYWIEATDPLVEVKKNNKTVYTFFRKRDWTKPLSLKVIDGDWIAEYEGDIVINGKNLRYSNMYNKVIEYTIIDGNVFYIFERGGKYHIYYKDGILDQTYDQIVYDQCCEPAYFNISSNDKMAWFYARKGHYWYYVEVIGESYLETEN